MMMHRLLVNVGVIARRSMFFVRVRVRVRWCCLCFVSPVNEHSHE